MLFANFKNTYNYYKKKLFKQESIFHLILYLLMIRVGTTSSFDCPIDSFIFSLSINKTSMDHVGYNSSNFDLSSTMRDFFLILHAEAHIIDDVISI